MPSESARGVPFNAVLLDLGNVLVHPKEAHFHRACEAVLAEGVRAHSPVEALCRAVWEGAASTDPTVFWATDAKARSWAVHARLPRDVGPAVWAELERLDTAADPLWSAPEPHAPAALDELRRCGLAVAVVSNSDGRAAQVVADQGLAPFVDVVLDSAVVGAAKPSPVIFRRAAELLGVTLPECVVVGDDPYFDIQGGLAAGAADAVLIDRFGIRPTGWSSRAGAHVGEVLSALAAGRPGAGPRQSHHRDEQRSR